MFKHRKSDIKFKKTAKKKLKYKPEIPYGEDDEDQGITITSDNVEESPSEEEESLDEDDADNSIQDEEEQTQRTSIRQELSTLTFEELEALKIKLGTKVYNEAMFGTKKANGEIGTSKKSWTSDKIFKRENHNRPREISSKVRVPKVREVVHVKKRRHRDPRFENICGELDEKLWKNNYSFLTEIEEKEHESLRAKLESKELEEDEKLKIKDYLQRVKNKAKSDAQKKKLEDKRRSEKEANVERMKEGKRPYYMKKSTRKYVDLAEKYDELKSSGKLESYLKKKRKKNAIRDKKSMK